MKKVGPYCNSYMPPPFVSDSSSITIKSFSGETETDVKTEGFMFTYKRVDASFGIPAEAPNPYFGAQPGGMAIPGGRPAFPAYGGGVRQLPPTAFGGFGARPGMPSQVILISWFRRKNHKPSIEFIHYDLYSGQ